MFKKAGIVAAAIAASVLAMTPLAFAGGNDPKSESSHSKSSEDDDDVKSEHDEDDGDDDGGDSNSEDDGDDSEDDGDDGDSATVDNSITQVQSNDCDFNQESTVINAPVVGELPVSTQLQTLNCVNVGDISVLGGGVEDGAPPAPPAPPAAAPGG